MHTTLLVTSGLLAMLSYATLIWDLVKYDRGQPLATRIALCFALSLSCVSVVIGHGKPGDLVISITYAALSFIALALTLSHGIKPLSTADKACLSLSILGAIAFAVSGHSGIGIAFAIGADIAAYWPTVLESWRRPETQPYVTYFFGLGAALLALIISMEVFAVAQHSRCT